MSQAIGTVHDKDSIFMHVYVGTARSEEHEYEMTAAMDYHPIIKSETTGKYFTLRWEDIINLAIQAGIDKEKNENE